MIYFLKGSLPTLNDHDKANRANRYVGAKMKQEWTDWVGYQLKGYPKVDQPSLFDFKWHISTKHDFDNIAFAKKYILDGMVASGVLPNDNPAWVRGFRDIFIRVNKGYERVIITTYPANDHSFEVTSATNV